MHSPKYHTVIFVPHAKARFRKFRVSDRMLKLGAAAAGLAVLLALSSTVSFFSGIRSSTESARLRGENDRLRDANRRYGTAIDGLKQRLDAFEVKTRRLAILAGISDTRELSRAASASPSSRGGPAFPASASPEPSGLSVPPAQTPQPRPRPQARLEELGSFGDLGRISRGSTEIAGRLEVLDDRFQKRQKRLSSTPTISPTAGILTDGYGGRSDPFEGTPAIHRALDISASMGSPVHAPGAGIVTRAGWENGYGQMIEVSHGYGYTTRYGHLSALLVQPGVKVSRGDLLGRVGSTGRSTGPHLHYEVLVDGEPTNPLEYILDVDTF